MVLKLWPVFKTYKLQTYEGGIGVGGVSFSGFMSSQYVVNGWSTAMKIQLTRMVAITKISNTVR